MKRAILMIGLIGLVLLSAGCQKQEDVPEVTVVPTKLPEKIETITIYSINSDTMSLIPVSVRKTNGGQLTAQSITNLVQSGLNDDKIKVENVSVENDKVIVSFSSKGRPVKDCSSQMEDLILECFANSLLDNVKNCKKVIFRCDGKAYHSSQYDFTINEVYASA